MNVLLRAIRFLLAQREKVLLGMMMLACAVTAFLATRQQAAEGSGEGGGVKIGDVIVWDKDPRPPNTYAKANLVNRQSLDEFSRLLDRRRSIFRPGIGGGPGPDGPKKQPWPDIRVRQVSQPTPGGAWIAQVEVGGRAYIVKEGRRFANRFELQRIDKTRLCVEVMRLVDDAVEEFCKE